MLVSYRTLLKLVSLLVHRRLEICQPIQMPGSPALSYIGQLQGVISPDLRFFPHITFDPNDFLKILFNGGFSKILHHPSSQVNH